MPSGPSEQRQAKVGRGSGLPWQEGVLCDGLCLKPPARADNESRLAFIRFHYGS